MISPRPNFILTCGVAALLTSASNAFAQRDADTWTGATDNNYNNAANWSLGYVPDQTQDTVNPLDAYINTSTGNISTVSTVIPVSPSDMRIGSGAGTSGRLDITAGSLATGSGNWTFDGVAGGTGVLNIANTATTGGAFTGFGTGSGSYTTYRMYVGSDQNPSTGNGALNINTTGTVTLNNDLYVAGGSTSTGTLNMDAGTLSRINGWCFVGGDLNGVTGATGTINQSGGTINMGQDTFVGRGLNSTGTLNLTGGTFNAVDGNGATNNGVLHIGFNSGAGMINMSGSSVTTTTNVFVLGDGTPNGAAGSQGTGTISGGATLNVGTEMWIGNGSHANNVFNANGGAVSVTSWVAVGRFGATGTLNMEGGTFTKLNNGNGFFDVGAGNNADNVGVVNLDSGALVLPKIISEGGTSTFNFNGGTLRANGDGTQAFNTTNVTFMQGLTTANVRNNGAVIDPNGFSITVPQPLLHSAIAGDSGFDGGLTVKGTAGGILTLTGASTYTGVTNVNAGATLIVNGGIGGGAAGAGPVTVSSGATLGGAGTINTGPNGVTVLGTLSPGASAAPGTIGTLMLATTSGGTLTLTSTATLAFDITNAATKDLIAMTGTTTLNVNGTLALNLGAGFDYTQIYTLVSGLTSEVGAFSSVTGVGAGETPVFNFTGGNYNLSFTAVPEPSTWALGLLGAAGLAVGARRRVGDWLRQRRAV